MNLACVNAIAVVMREQASDIVESAYATAANSAHIMTLSITVRGLLNMTALAAVRRPV